MTIFFLQNERDAYMTESSMVVTHTDGNQYEVEIPENSEEMVRTPKPVPRGPPVKRRRVTVKKQQLPDGYFTGESNDDDSEYNPDDDSSPPLVPLQQRLAEKKKKTVDNPKEKCKV